MSVRSQHSYEKDWYITVTCFEWLPLFELTNSYDLVYNWFKYLKQKDEADILSYVIMPNHFHAIIHLRNEEGNLNKLVANGKRFMAYEIIKRLEIQSEKVSAGVSSRFLQRGSTSGYPASALKVPLKRTVTAGSPSRDPAYAQRILKRLAQGVTKTDKKKGQKHRVFEPSFDAKYVQSDKFILQKLNYIHHNPVKGKWNLVDDFTDYEHSSASFYELGVVKHFKPRDYREIWYPDEYE